MEQEALDEVQLTLAYTVKELNQLLLALGELPYARAHQLVQEIHAKAGPQVEAAVKKYMEDSAVNDPKVVTDVKDTTPGPEAA